MPILGFEKRFVDDLVSGRKTQTIRPFRKDGKDPIPGSRLYFYTGSFSSRRTKIGEATCIDRDIVTIDAEQVGSGIWDEEVRVANRRVNCEDFARADGFENAIALFEYIERTYGLPFEGLLIRWDGAPSNAAEGE